MDREEIEGAALSLLLMKGDGEGQRENDGEHISPLLEDEDREEIEGAAQSLLLMTRDGEWPREHDGEHISPLLEDEDSSERIPQVHNPQDQRMEILNPHDEGQSPPSEHAEVENLGDPEQNQVHNPPEQQDQRMEILNPHDDGQSPPPEHAGGENLEDPEQNRGRWTSEEMRALMHLVSVFGRNWNRISEEMGTRSPRACERKERRVRRGL